MKSRDKRYSRIVNKLTRKTMTQKIQEREKHIEKYSEMIKKAKEKS